jgi:hypothetical protein
VHVQPILGESLVSIIEVSQIPQSMPPQNRFPGLFAVLIAMQPDIVVSSGDGK